MIGKIGSLQNIEENAKLLKTFANLIVGNVKIKLL